MQVIKIATPSDTPYPRQLIRKGKVFLLQIKGTDPKAWYRYSGDDEVEAATNWVIMKQLPPGDHVILVADSAPNNRHPDGTPKCACSITINVGPTYKR